MSNRHIGVVTWDGVIVAMESDSKSLRCSEDLTGTTEPNRKQMSKHDTKTPRSLHLNVTIDSIKFLSVRLPRL